MEVRLRSSGQQNFSSDLARENFEKKSAQPEEILLRTGLVIFQKFWNLF